jgi:hypothetical protein
MNRIALAVACAPLAAPFAVVLYVLFSGDAVSAAQLLWIAVPALVVSYSATFVAGIPLIWLLRRLGQFNLPAVVFVGCCLGPLVFMLFEIGLGSALGSAAETAWADDAVWGGILGGLVALAFGLIAGVDMRRERPISIR